MSELVLSYITRPSAKFKDVAWKNEGEWTFIQVHQEIEPFQSLKLCARVHHIHILISGQTVSISNQFVCTLTQRIESLPVDKDVS